MLAFALATATAGALLPGAAATDLASPLDPDTTFLLPPYTGSTFTGDAVADHHTGLLSVHVAKAGGLSGEGKASVWMVHELPQDAGLIEYEIALDWTVQVPFGYYACPVRIAASVHAPGGHFDYETLGSGPGAGPATISLRLEPSEGVVPAGNITLRIGLSGCAESCAVSYPPPPHCTFQVWWFENAGTAIAQATVRSITAAVHPAAGVPPEEQEGPIELEASGYKEQGRHHVDLQWTNATSAVDIVRDDVVVATTDDDGAYTDSIGAKGQATYMYRVCETGTSTCSAKAVVEF